MFIRLANWESAKGRRDIKNPLWFKFEWKFIESNEVKSLNSDEFRVLITLMCMASKHGNSGILFLNEENIANNANVKRKKISDVIKKLQSLQLVEISDDENPYGQLKVTRTRSVKLLSTSRALEKKRKEKKREDEELLASLEDIYASYPRKQGKEHGMKSFLKQALDSDSSAEFFKQLASAVRSYASKRSGQDEQYTLLWSTFANRWREYLPSATQSAAIDFEFTQPPEYEFTEPSTQNVTEDSEQPENSSQIES